MVLLSSFRVFNLSMYVVLQCFNRYVDLFNYVTLKIRIVSSHKEIAEYGSFVSLFIESLNKIVDPASKEDSKYI